MPRKEKPFHLLQWYSLISFVCIILISIILIFVLSRFLKNNTLLLDATETHYFVKSILEAENASLYFSLEDKTQQKALFSKLAEKIKTNPEIRWVKVYDMAGTILWATDTRFIGHNFMPNSELIQALSGSIGISSGTSGRPRKGEHVFDEVVPYFSEIYLPVPSIDGEGLVGAIEVYKIPHSLFGMIDKGVRLVWISTGLGGVFLYFALFWIVKRASFVIRRQQEHLTDANTRLEEKIKDSELTAGALGSLLITTGAASHERFFHDCVRDLAKIYGVQYAYAGVFSDDTRTHIRTLAVWNKDGFVNNFEYTVAGTPSRDVLDGHITLVPCKAIQKYPAQTIFSKMSVESYFGAALLSPLKTILGLVVIMDTQPMSPQVWAKPLLGILANRMALELERQSADTALKLAESVFHESNEGIIVTDRDGIILRINPAFTKMVGYTEKEVVGKNPRLFSSKQHDEAFFTNFWTDLRNNGVWQGEIWDRRRNGEAFPTWQSITAVRDKTGEIIQFISIISDITEKKISEERIYQLAHFDVLTGLSNRASFQNQFSRALAHAARKNGKLALLYLDIDHFKLVNDAYGHAVGDEVLKHVSQCLSGLVREEDLVARLGGDEFTILLSGLQTSQDTALIAKKILQHLATPFVNGHTEIAISASIGISLFPENGKYTAVLLKCADTAMYRAKESGRNNFQFFTSEMNQEVQKRLTMENDLRKAIERNEFLLYYQPQLHISSGKIIACEALVRWQHPTEGLIAPSVFIPIAEKSGLIDPLVKWVLETACRQWKQWQHHGIGPVTMAVNLSGQQFTSSHLVRIIKDTLQETGADPHFLELELTESVLVLNIKETNQTLNTLRDMGISLSIDDFGTGYSSMAYLKRFPINKLKIDQSFVRDLASDPNDAAIVTATIALAHSLNLKVIAEGVETPLQLEFLKKNGCDQYQGFYFSRPLPFDQITPLLKSKPLQSPSE